MQDYQKLKVWEKAHVLVLAVYAATRSFPTTERYGLTSQMRRSATSIATNIAEGCGRGSQPDFARLLHISMGSANELHYQLLLARDLELLSADDHGSLDRQVIEVRRMLAALLSRVGARPN